MAKVATADNDIHMFMHCVACVNEGHTTRHMQAGVLADHQTLRLWCGRHDRLIADFKLPEKLAATCAHCGVYAVISHHN